MQQALPNNAQLIESKTGYIHDPGGPRHGMSAEVRWYCYAIPSGTTYYIEAYVEGERIFRRSARGKSIPAWREAYHDMASVICPTVEE